MSTDQAPRAAPSSLFPLVLAWLAVGLPLAWGVGTGAQMLQPLGVAVIGALVISVLLSLVATPVAYLLLIRTHNWIARKPSPAA